MTAASTLFYTRGMALAWSVWKSSMERKFAISECLSGLRVTRKVDGAEVGVYRSLADAARHIDRHNGSPPATPQKRRIARRIARYA